MLFIIVLLDRRRKYFSVFGGIFSIKLKKDKDIYAVI